MFKIIKIEWLKVKYYRTFWVLLILAIIMIPAANLVVSDISGRISKKMQGILGKGPFEFPLVWQTVANINSYTALMFGLVLITLVTNEFTYKTHRQNVIDGWERRDFVLSKIYWVIGLSLVALLVTVITGLVFGFMGSSALSFEGFVYIWYYWLQLILSLCIALLAGMLFKRSGLATVLYLGYVMFLEQLLVVTIKRFAGPIGGLLPLQTGDELTPFPVVGQFIDHSDSYSDQVYLILMLVYIAGIIWWVFRKMLRTDL
jgi:ABC-2 type transport system permease protein